jgi:hypothetical protein
MRPPAKIVDILVRSLEGTAPGWTFDPYRATHAGFGAEIWIANQLYGIHVNVGGARYADGTNIWGFLVPWRRRLYRAAIKAAERRVLTILEAHYTPSEVAAVEQAARERL